MYFSRNELVAMTKMAQAMAAADGRVDAREVVLIAAQLAKFSSDETIIDAADNIEASDALIILKNMTIEEKKYVCGFLAALSAVDGVDAKEVALWQLVSTLAQFPKMSFNDALQFWGEH